MFEKWYAKKQFLVKKSLLRQRLQHDVMEDGTACIPCRVKGLDDIISRFSIPGVETLDSEFALFILEYEDFIPSEYPLVLEIYGPLFTDAEKKLIEDTIHADMDYMLGKAETVNLRRKKKLFTMMAGTIISGILLSLVMHWLPEIPQEFLFVVFWLFADSLVRYIFIDRMEYKEEKVRAGRLAGMKVRFVEEEKE